MNDTPNIPQQNEGAKTDILHSVTAKTRDQALAIFKRAYQRLLNVNLWHKLGGNASAEFELVPSQEKEHSVARVGDYFKIDIPGPGSQSGDGYDWVRVEKIEDNTDADAEHESFMMQVRPSQNPESKNESTAHFLTDEATSTFIIEREKNKITASVHGRNELPNTITETFIDKIRNAVIGSTAAMGASKFQWKLLVKGLIDDDAEK
jgi:hypothetical protein